MLFKGGSRARQVRCRLSWPHPIVTAVSPAESVNRHAALPKNTLNNMENAGMRVTATASGQILNRRLLLRNQETQFKRLRTPVQKPDFSGGNPEIS